MFESLILKGGTEIMERGRKRKELSIIVIDGIEYPSKICPLCNINKLITEFYAQSYKKKNGDLVTNHNTYCKPCAIKLKVDNNRKKCHSKEKSIKPLSKGYKGRNRQYQDIDFSLLYKIYMKDNISLREISEKYSLTTTTLHERFKELPEYISKGEGRKNYKTKRKKKRRIEDSDLNIKLIDNYQKVYKFENTYLKEDIGLIPKNKSGIYIIYNKKTEIVYVGQAVDLKSRLTGHFNGVTHTNDYYEEFHAVSIILVKNEDLLNSVEKDVIKTLKPKYNVTYNIEATNEYEDYFKFITKKIGQYEILLKNIRNNCELDESYYTQINLLLEI